MVRGRESLDLNAGDPPPDLVIEIDISTNSLDKRRLYANLAVREFWRFDGSAISFFELEGSGYALVDRSSTFPWFPADKLSELLEARLRLGETQTLRQFRDWVREQI
ncbi:MAG: Uma2 family endonuclease [Cyanobacteria bacterium P01_A01_bin.123]